MTNEPKAPDVSRCLNKDQTLNLLGYNRMDLQKVSVVQVVLIPLWVLQMIKMW